MVVSTPVEIAVKSASYNIVLQVLMRILSSLSNAIILRFITREALGVVNVRLLLLYSTCQFFSREAFRRSCMSTFNPKNFNKKFNLLWLTFPSCLFYSLFLGYIWLHLLEKPSPDLVPSYSLGIYVVLLSVMIEILSEPVYVFSQSYNFVKLKVVVEGLSLTVRSTLMVTLLTIWPKNPMYAFSISQGISSCIYTAAFYIYFWWYFRTEEKESESKLPIHSIKEFLPRISNFFVDWNDLYLTWSFLKQTLLKQLLTEGERYVMTFFSVMSFAEQGLYDVVSNLGSLSARFVFLPIEDSGYCLFTQLLSRNKKENSQQNILRCFQILETLLKLLLLLGLTILMFGYSYSQLLLLLYGGSVLSSSVAVTLLRWHCVYVLFLALNGITECFKFAVMSHSQLDAYNKSMVLLSSGFLIAAFCLAKVFGGVGFIMANCVNMALRIIHSICYISMYFKIPNIAFVKSILPHHIVVIILAVSLGLTSVSEKYFCCDQGIKLWIWHLIFGALCFAICIASVILKEKSMVNFIYEQWRKKNTDSKKTL